MASGPDQLFRFPTAPSPDAVEWPGELLGRSNVVTRTKNRTNFHDKTIDRTPGRLEHLVNAAIAHVVQNAHREPIYLSDVIIHGIRVRAITNSAHLIKFWRVNWYSPEEWEAQTGISPPIEPTIVVYALSGVSNEPEAAYYSRESNTIIFFNTSYYGQLKSWVLGAVGRVLAADYGIHSLHGACVERAGSGILYIAPTGTGKSTSSYGLMTHGETRFHSDDWVYVRYARHTSDNQLLVPIEITLPAGGMIRGFRCHPWIDENPRARALARCLDLSNVEVTVDVRSFDHKRPPEAYAYTSEKLFYLRTNLIENFPDTCDAFVTSDLENVPTASDRFLTANASTIDSIVEGIQTSVNPHVRRQLGTLAADTLRGVVGSLFAFDNARAMLDITRVFPASQVFTNPMEPVRLGTVFLLKRDPTDPVVLKVLSQNDLFERLMVGQTPDGKREIAYNAYRAVDDDEEKAAVEGLAETSKRQGKPLYAVFQAAKDLPESLVEEFSLFRQLFQATLCYDLNTTLQRDARVTSTKEAVRLTLELILRGAENRRRDFCLTLDNYRMSIHG